MKFWHFWEPTAESKRLNYHVVVDCAETYVAWESGICSEWTPWFQGGSQARSGFFDRGNSLGAGYTGEILSAAALSPLSVAPISEGIVDSTRHTPASESPQGALSVAKAVKAHAHYWQESCAHAFRGAV